MPDLRYGIRYLRFTQSARIDDITTFVKPELMSGTFWYID